MTFKEEDQEEEQEQHEPSFEKVDKRHSAEPETIPASEQEAAAEASAQQPVDQEEPEQAKVAIDTLEFVVGKLEPDLESQEKAELDSVLSNLQINYVKRA